MPSVEVMEAIPTKMHSGIVVWDQAKLQIYGCFRRGDRHPTYDGPIFGNIKRGRQYWKSPEMLLAANAYGAEYAKNNSEKRLAYRRKKYWESPEDYREKARKDHAKNKDRNNASCRKYYEENKESCAIYHKKYYEENKDQILENAKEYSKLNSDKIKKRGDAYRKRTHGAILARATNYRKGKEEEARQYAKQYREANPSKVRDDAKRWRLANPAYCAARGSARRTRMKVSNLSENQRDEIIKIYEFRDELNLCALSSGAMDVFHVDHIMPLKHKLFSGLHAPWNLEIIPAKENLRKGNRVAGY